MSRAVSISDLGKSRKLWVAFVEKAAHLILSRRILWHPKTRFVKRKRDGPFPFPGVDESADLRRAVRRLADAEDSQSLSDRYVLDIFVELAAVEDQEGGSQKSQGQGDAESAASKNVTFRGRGALFQALAAQEEKDREKELQKKKKNAATTHHGDSHDPSLRQVILERWTFNKNPLPEYAYRKWLRVYTAATVALNAVWPSCLLLPAYRLYRSNRRDRRRSLPMRYAIYAERDAPHVRLSSTEATAGAATGVAADLQHPLLHRLDFVPVITSVFTVGLGVRFSRAALSHVLDVRSRRLCGLGPIIAGGARGAKANGERTPKSEAVASSPPASSGSSGSSNGASSLLTAADDTEDSDGARQIAVTSPTPRASTPERPPATGLLLRPHPPSKAIDMPRPNYPLRRRRRHDSEDVEARSAPRRIDRVSGEHFLETAPPPLGVLREPASPGLHDASPHHGSSGAAAYGRTPPFAGFGTSVEDTPMSADPHSASSYGASPPFGSYFPRRRTLASPFSTPPLSSFAGKSADDQQPSSHSSIFGPPSATPPSSVSPPLSSRQHFPSSFSPPTAASNGNGVPEWLKRGEGSNYSRTDWPDGGEGQKRYTDVEFTASSFTPPSELPPFSFDEYDDMEMVGEDDASVVAATATPEGRDSPLLLGDASPSASGLSGASDSRAQRIDQPAGLPFTPPFLYGSPPEGEGSSGSASPSPGGRRGRRKRREMSGELRHQHPFFLRGESSQRGHLFSDDYDDRDGLSPDSPFPGGGLDEDEGDGMAFVDNEYDFQDQIAPGGAVFSEQPYDDQVGALLRRLKRMPELQSFRQTDDEDVDVELSGRRHRRKRVALAAVLERLHDLENQRTAVLHAE